MMRTILTLLFQGVIPMFLGLGGGQYLGQAKQNAATAENAVGQYGTNATAEGASLNPFFANEMTAQHSLSPDQQNEMLTAAQAGAGGAFGGAEGEMNANAARTGNATTLTKSLDEMARDKAKSAAGSSEGVAAQDVMGAQQLRQEGAAGMQGLYGTNVNAQLGAMKQANADVGTEMQATGPNWLSQIDQLAKTGGDIAGAITGGAAASKALQGG
jgi:hypothetical protein